MPRKSKAKFELKGHTLPGINQKSETSNIEDGRSPSSAFQMKESSPNKLVGFAAGLLAKPLIKGAKKTLGLGGPEKSGGKLLEDTGKNFFAEELNVIHDFTDVSLLEYGDLTAGPGASSAGFGTFGATLKGGNININFHPNVSVALT